MLPLSKNLLSTTLLGTAFGAGAIVAGPLYAAPTVGSDINGPQVQIISPSYQDVLKGKFRISVAIKATSYNPASIELFVDDRPATDGPMALSSFPSSSFDWITTKFADGPHKLTVRVTDTQGFRGWAEVNVFINNNRVVDTLPPTLDWKNLKNFETLSGTAQVQLQAADNFGVKWIYVSINPTTADAEKKAVAGTAPKQQPLRSWLLNRPPYIVDFDTTKVPDGLYKLTAKAFDSNDQQGDAHSMTVGVVNNSINATTVGGLLDGLRIQDEATHPQPKLTVTDPTSPSYGGYSDLFPGGVSSTDPVSGTDAGDKTVTTEKPAPQVKAPAKATSKATTPRLSQPSRVASAKGVPESHVPVAQPDLSARRGQDVMPSSAAPLPAETETETPKEWGDRLALAQVPSGGARALTEGQMSVTPPTESKLLARSDAAPLSADASTAAMVAPAAPVATAPATSPDEIANALQVSDHLGAPVAVEPNRLARLSRPDAQLRVLDEPALSETAGSRVALAGVISTREVTPALIKTVNEQAPTVVETSSSSVDPHSKTALSQAALEARSRPAGVGIKPRPAQRMAAALNAVKTAAIKVVSGVKGRSTNPILASLPRTDRNNITRSAITPAITVAPLELSEPVSIPAAYRVDRNTTLAAVAARYHLPVELVAACNGLEGNVRVSKGTKITLPRPLQVTYAGRPVKSDVGSLMVGDTSTTAFRFMFEQAGGKLDWDAKNHRVTARKGDNQIVVTIGSNRAKVNDREVMMELAAFLFEGRTMVPVRFFEEGLNARVQWDPQTGRLVVAMAR